MGDDRDHGGEEDYGVQSATSESLLMKRVVPATPDHFTDVGQRDEFQRNRTDKNWERVKDLALKR
jgi:hypothetical protein